MNYRADTVPEWDSRGVIPALDENDPTSSRRSPYRVSVYDLVMRFGHSETRRSLIAGLLDYRAELREVGLVRGFQWIDGSFVEDIERTEDRSPRSLSEYR